MNRRDAVAVAIIVAVVTLVFSDVLFFGRAFYFRDVTRFYYPMKKVTRDIILSGEFPSWNPALSEGQPLAANPEFAVFYPPNWLLMLPNYEVAFRLHIVLHYYLAAIGVYALLRSRALRIESAMFGAFAYTFGGLLVSLSCLVPYLFCLAWLPWIAFFSLKETKRGAAIAAICLAMVFLGGEPVTIAQCILLLAIFVWRRAPLLAAFTFIAALLIASVQIVPAADHLRDSVRSRPFPYSLVSTWSTPPVKIAELFVPRALGSAEEHARFYWGTAKYGWLDPFFLSIYPGLLTSALAFAAIVTRQRGWIAVLIVSAAGFVIAFGDHTPLLKLLYDTRLFSSFRYPEKFLILAVVPLTIFGAFAFDRLDEKVIRAAIVIASVVGVICLLLAFTSTEAFIHFWAIEVHPLRNAMAGLSSRVWLAGLARAIVVIALLLIRKRMQADTWSRLAIIVLVISLGIERRAAAETIEREFFSQRPRSIPKVANGTRLFHQADWYNATPIARTYFDLPEMYWVIRNGAYPHTNANWGIDSALNRDIDQTALLPTADLLAAMRQLRTRTQRWVEPLAAISNASTRAVFTPVLQAGRGKSIQPIVFVPVRSNPRFYFADRVVQGDFVSVASSPSWTQRTAVTSTAMPQPGSGDVLSVAQGSNWANLRVRATGESLLVCSITRHKYWHATLDGRAVPLVAANIAYQALRVPAGTHDVKLCYDNPLLRWCGVISLISFVITLLFVLRHDRAELRSG